MNSHYDVIIVGGRNAGSSLAMRLAKQNLSVFLIDRANFPSLPQVPSSPMIHAGTMRLLDELGIKEEEYANPGARIDNFAVNFVGHFDAVMPASLMKIDRNYGYGIDRNRFDTVLWETAGKSPNVTAYSNFSATSILKENGRVVGLVGKDGDGKEHRVTADLVVGADGRFSWTAREVAAEVVEERNEYVGTSYHAEWENVEPYSQEHPRTVAFYNTAKGFVVLLIPIDTKKYIVANYMTIDKVNFGPQKLESNYLEGLQSIPEVWERLKNARKVTDIVGVKGIQNGYRKPYGEGWALVGDALHYKDPVDGQGIYDALLGTKLLAEAIHLWKAQGCSWEESMSSYKEEFWKATHPMFLQTVGRIKEQAYTEPPAIIIKTVIRWMLQDPEYQATFLKYLHRAIDPKDYPTPHPKYILNGIKRDLFGN
jgi:2-polyprenyl-6-methoxyphenol hydroxylase-like FAD-dependent oxidoreductase